MVVILLLQKRTAISGDDGERPDRGASSADEFQWRADEGEAAYARFKNRPSRA
jgi:hypothetical protein